MCRINHYFYFYFYAPNIDDIATTMVLVSTSSSDDDFLNIRETAINANSEEMNAFLEAHGHIPTNGDGDAFGFGVLTIQGLDTVVVSTTHAGVQDSEEQSDANDPVWPNHFITLGQDSCNCGNDLKVEAITFQSQGQVNITDSNTELTEIPASFSGTDALSGEDLTMEPGIDVDVVVSFKLSPQFSDDELEAVCVTDIQFAENIVFENSNGNSSNNSDGTSNSNENANDEDDGPTQGIDQLQSSTNQ